MKDVDERVLRGALAHFRRYVLAERQRRRLDHFFDTRMVVRYEKDGTNELAALCDKYGSDKDSLTSYGHPYSWAPHGYADFYSLLLAPRRSEVRNVFECGVGTNNPAFVSNMGEAGRPGASLRVWRDYFPNATVVGADIDREVLFTEDRIATYYVDQRDARSVAALWSKVNVTSFDLMIDDGLHEFAAGSCLFDNSIKMLAPDGVYIIEDVGPEDLLSYHDFFAEKPVKVQYVSLDHPALNLEDNNLVVIRPSHGCSSRSQSRSTPPSSPR